MFLNKSRFRNFLPLLYIFIEIPFLSVRTVVMGERLEAEIREYISLRVRVWKWKWEFELYDTTERRENRKFKPV